MSRATQLDVDEVRRLDHFATSLDVMFPSNIGIIHCGSSLHDPNYLDVDVRVVLLDEDFTRIAESVNILDLNMLATEWGRRVTGLRVDVQLQSVSDADAEGSGARERHGITAMARWRRPLDRALTAKDNA